MACMRWIFLTGLLITHGHLRVKSATGSWVEPANTSANTSVASPPEHARICVLIRSCQRDSLHLQVLLTELCNAQLKQTDGFYQLRFFVFNTDEEKESGLDDSFIDAAHEDLARTPCAGSMEKLTWPDASKLFSIWPQEQLVEASKRTNETNYSNVSNDTYGYDMTNRALALILSRETSQHDSDCAYFLTTNSDNMYNQHLFESTAVQLREGNDLVCFDFVSNHGRPRLHANGSDSNDKTFFQLFSKSVQVLVQGFTQFLQQNLLGIVSRNQTTSTNQTLVPRQVISVAIGRGQVDLGSCFVSGQAVRTLLKENSGSVYKPPWYFSDYSFYEQIMQRNPQPRVALIHEVLQIHQ